MNTHALTLTAELVAAHAAHFSRLMARFLPHTSHTLYFPPQTPPQTPQSQWLPRERSVLLPLVRGESGLGGLEGPGVLGVFVAHGVEARSAKRFLPMAPALTALCLDTLEETLRSRTDPLTGLDLPHVLLHRLCDEAAHIRADYDGTPPLHRLCAGLILICWPDRRAFAVEHGHMYTDDLTRALAQVLRKETPANAIAARISDNEFALLLPSATRTACRTVMDALMPALASVRLPHPVTRTRLGAECVAHCRAYPQDIPSASLALPMEEQSRILLELVRQASRARTVSAQENARGEHQPLPHMTAKDATSLRRLLAACPTFIVALLHAPEPLALEEWLDICAPIMDIPCRAAFVCENHIVRVHTATTAHTLEHEYAKICHKAAERGVVVSVGLAAYPVLQSHKDEMLLCAYKALVLAQLLPAPHVGIFGSLALNISADKLYSAGEVFAALEEYRRALLLDPRNTLAWNSLGVCLADISQPLEARHAFLRANALKPDDSATLYNLGSVCQSLGSNRAAAHWYRRCAAAAPTPKTTPENTEPVAYHTFAHIRLGQLAEKNGQRQRARHYYQHAATPNQERGVRNTGISMALRHLARMDCKRDPDTARASLHEALRHNPDDALALEMLARLYLEGAVDPGMAVMLARQSIALRPTLTQAWSTLARALRMQGHEAEACKAEARA